MVTQNLKKLWYKYHRENLNKTKEKNSSEGSTQKEELRKLDFWEWHLTAMKIIRDLYASFPWHIKAIIQASESHSKWLQWTVTFRNAYLYHSF